MDRILSALACALALNLVGFTLPSLPFAGVQPRPAASIAGRTATVMGVTGSAVRSSGSERLRFTVVGDHGLAEVAVVKLR